MKNQYFADRNDYFKYDLLVFLAEHLAAKRLSVIWMLKPDDGSPGGGKVEYSQGAADRGLYRFLRKCLDQGSRNVARMDDYFREAGHQFDYCAYGTKRLLIHQGSGTLLRADSAGKPGCRRRVPGP